MVGEFPVGGKALTTVTALVRRATQVCQVHLLNMSLEVTDLLEQFAAVLAAELLVPGVDQCVGLQLVLPPEPLVAGVAGEGQETAVVLLPLLAGEEGGAAGGAVHLLVLGLVLGVLRLPGHPHTAHLARILYKVYLHVVN